MFSNPLTFMSLKCNTLALTLKHLIICNDAQTISPGWHLKFLFGRRCCGNGPHSETFKIQCH